MTDRDQDEEKRRVRRDRSSAVAAVDGATLKTSIDVTSVEDEATAVTHAHDLGVHGERAAVQTATADHHRHARVLCHQSTPAILRHDVAGKTPLRPLRPPMHGDSRMRSLSTGNVSRKVEFNIED